MPPKKRSGIKPPPSPRGDARGRFRAGAGASATASIASPIEHHNPMEPHASTVICEGDGKLTIHDKTQGVQNSQGYVAERLRPVEGPGPRDLALRRRRLRLGPAAAIPAVPGRHGGARAEALGAGGADPRPDVHLRLPAGDDPDDLARRQSGRHAPGHHPRGRAGDLDVRGLPGGRSSTGRACSTTATTSS